ncbi:potassium channel family protein [Neoactinobaculum massilliense]|uniref:potassium channel family protein n=1 Tax=Neoactinobaculum massilliense TaxID=2364794 RepID=UPI000F53956E|nr:TrkA family potassium uptake protein [Neoactinobaculum massilliense]
MNILIVGAGAVGRSVARELVAANNLTIIDVKPQAMKISSVPEADWQLGDACEIPTLEAAGAGEADIVVAATGDDRVNLVTSLLAKTEFGVERVIARVNNPKNEWLFNDSWGVDVTVSTPRTMTALVQDAVADGSLSRVLVFHRSGASLWQATVADTAPARGTTVAALGLPAGVAITAIVRDGAPFAADPDLTFDAGDQVLLIGTIDKASMGTVEALFRGAAA